MDHEQAVMIQSRQRGRAARAPGATQRRRERREQEKNAKALSVQSNGRSPQDGGHAIAVAAPGAAALAPLTLSPVVSMSSQ